VLEQRQEVLACGPHEADLVTIASGGEDLVRDPRQEIGRHGPGSALGVTMAKVHGTIFPSRRRPANPVLS
jgi:hypothetical protein